MPDCGATFLLPRMIGWQRAKGIMIMGETIDAKTALDIGFVNKVFPKRRFEKELLELVTQVVHLPTRSQGLIKKALNYSFTADLDKQLDIEEQLQSIASQTEAHKKRLASNSNRDNPVS